MPQFALFMNPVTANAEQYIPVALAEERETLERLLVTDSCEPYTKGNYRLSYIEGSILENFNPPQMHDGYNVFGVLEGINEVVSEDDIRQAHLEELKSFYHAFSTAVML